jgi:transposase
MSNNELSRFELFVKLSEKSINQLQVADALGISVRQVKRLAKKFKKLGGISLVSKKRGKTSNHQLKPGLKECILALIQAHYSDFGPTLAHEKLIEVHELEVSLWTVRQIMIKHNLWDGKRRKKRRVFQLRERRGCKGELIQIDGSPHAWFEGRGPECTLVHGVDDATGEIMAAFFAPTETTWAYFNMMKTYLKNHGRPTALYSDRHGIFRINKIGAIHGDGITQFSRAMKDLDIKTIHATTAQAKGRIERANRTLQDRLIKELRLQKISTLDEANAFLPKFIQDYNRRFGKVAKNPNNAHRALLKEHCLDSMFTHQEFRKLTKNLILQYKNTFYQIMTDRPSYALFKAEVTVHEDEKGRVELFYKGKKLSYMTYRGQERQGDTYDSKTLNEAIDRLQGAQQPVSKPKYKPSLNHPYKRYFKRFLKKTSL